MESLADDPVDHLRVLCLAYPAVTERLSHGEPTWFVAGKRVLAQLDDHHHGADHLAFSCAAPEGVQGLLVESDSDQFFRPPYVGAKGWIGVRIDRDPDWDHISVLLDDAFRLVAPKRLVALWEARR